MLLAWAAAGLGVLTKGLEAAVIPAAVLVLYSLLSRDLSPWRRLEVGWGMPLFLAITVPWHWLAARRLPDFLQFFFVHEHFARYLTPSADREEPWWFFGGVLALGTLPWTGSVLRVLGSGWRRRAARGQFDATQFLWIWAVFIVVFFSLSDSKLIPYVLPALPALALAVGELKIDVLRRDVGVTALLSLLVAVALIAAAVAAPRYLADTVRNGYFVMLGTPLWKVAILLALSGLFALWQRRPDATRAAIVLSLGWCLAGLLLMHAAGVVAPVYSGIVLARALEDGGRDTPLFSVATYDQGLPFYWRRTVTPVAYRGELDFGLRHDEQAGIRTVPEFVARWQDLPKGYAVMEIDMFDDLQRRGVPLREVARDVHRVLAARR
jgi:4-amino-4-deoxy-L-arabinose transferase-like glycosyltransferase